MNKVEIKDYIKTTLFTTFLVFFCCLVAELNLYFQAEQKVKHDELSIKNLEKFSSIEELTHKLELNPDNYIVMIRLAQIHESLYEFKIANKIYSDAVEKSARADFALYSYALFCANQKMYTLAATLGEEISQQNERTNFYKAKLYERIGDNFSQDKDFNAANKAYQVSYKYSKTLNNPILYNQMRNKYAQSYLDLADYHINIRHFDEALLDIENSKKIKDTLEATYKSALVYYDTDMKKSQRLMASVLRRNPYLVNPTLYNNLLNRLISEAKLQNDLRYVDYYQMQLKNFKKLMNYSYIYKNDITIVNLKFEKKKNFYIFKGDNVIEFQVQNNQNYPINNLFMYIEIFCNNTLYKIDKFPKNISITSATDTGVTEKILLKLPSDLVLDNLIKEKAIVKFYAKKKKIAPWTLVKIMQYDF